jgi:transcriptional regulator with AAA-type ATPase domain
VPKRHLGRFRYADSGMLFLYELATLPMQMREKLLE